MEFIPTINRQWNNSNRRCFKYNSEGITPQNKLIVVLDEFQSILLYKLPSILHATAFIRSLEQPGSW